METYNYCKCSKLNDEHILLEQLESEVKDLEETLKYTMDRIFKEQDTYRRMNIKYNHLKKSIDAIKSKIKIIF